MMNSTYPAKYTYYYYIICVMFGLNPIICIFGLDIAIDKYCVFLQNVLLKNANACNELDRFVIFMSLLAFTASGIYLITKLINYKTKDFDQFKLAMFNYLQKVKDNKEADKKLEWKNIHEGDRLSQMLEREKKVVSRIILPLFLVSAIVLVYSLLKPII